MLGRKRKADDGPQDIGPAFPALLAYVWEWFVEIRAGIAPNGMAPIAIGWRDLAAWSDLTGERLRPWEVRLLIRLSMLCAEIDSERQDSPS